MRCMKLSSARMGAAGIRGGRLHPENLGCGAGQTAVYPVEPQESLFSVAFHPSGKKVIAGADRMIREWDIDETAGTMTVSNSPMKAVCCG